MADPWFKFYPSDWLGGTRGLTAAETGIYVTLIAMMYERRAPIDMDMTRLARLCGCPAGSFKRALDGLIEAGKIERTEAGLWNARVQIEIQDREVASRNGSDAAQSRWRKGGKKDKQNQQDEDADAPDAQCAEDAMPEARSQKEDVGKPTSCAFADFWAVWPNRTAKAAAETAWKRLSLADREVALASAPDWFAAWRRAHPDASPIHPATYLNKRRWLDEQSPPPVQSAHSPHLWNLDPAKFNDDGSRCQ